VHQVGDQFKSVLWRTVRNPLNFWRVYCFNFVPFIHISHVCLISTGCFFRCVVIFQSLTDFLAPYFILYYFCIRYVRPVDAIHPSLLLLSTLTCPFSTVPSANSIRSFGALQEGKTKARQFDPSICGWHAFHILSSLNHTSDITLGNSLCRRHLIFMFHYPATPKRRITVTIFLCHLQFLMCQRRYSCCYPCRLWHHVSCRLFPACRYGLLPIF
jgi:hypothetical protein